MIAFSNDSYMLPRLWQAPGIPEVCFVVAVSLVAILFRARCVLEQGIQADGREGQR